EPFDAAELALSLRALEDDRAVVAALEVEVPLAVHDGVGPAAEEIDVVREVHRVDGVRARRARGDLAEHDLAVALAIPLHVRESRLLLQRFENISAVGAALVEFRIIEMAQRHGLRADPLRAASDQRPRAISGDVLEYGSTVDADRVFRVFLGCDPFFDVVLAVASRFRERVLQIAHRVDAKRVLRARAGDRLETGRKSDLFRGG